MVSHESPRRSVTTSGTELPLSPHCNPTPAHISDSLGDFHNSVHRLLSSFASRLSRGNIAPRPWPGVCAPDTSVPICSRKAGYAVHSAPESRCTAIQVLILPRTEVALTAWEYASAQQQVSTAAGSGSPCHWRPPFRRRRNCYAFPQHPPQTGRKKQAPKVSQLCPLKDF